MSNKAQANNSLAHTRWNCKYNVVFVSVSKISQLLLDTNTEHFRI